MNGTVWDPLRKKEVALTPEEEVRQWFIAVLKDSVGVPEHQMMSEVELPSGPAGKAYRADIVIYGPGGRRLGIVECKRPEVKITAAVMEQAQRYSALLEVPYIFVTNGPATYVFCNGRQLNALPSYAEMKTI